MTIGTEFIWILIGTALVTLLPRVLPLSILSRVQMPSILLKYLRHIPVAVMAALLAQALLTSEEGFIPIQDNPRLLALLPTLAAALWSRSLLTTVIVGVLSMMLIRQFFG
ncbi:AzlD domain-containing protein [Paenibacillus nanensis]|uniref:AzlD domain-containing protein n=1 Tax=Paenibacillus nanensis TaxID=393251 RepID=A0A3A1ULF1_9BACL|nr:AzlD domain-containing protein [Paenibacillus nanensis]RIX47070.1 AzlD domain-containing protein [Paenibacillus nanensis]